MEGEWGNRPPKDYEFLQRIFPNSTYLSHTDMEQTHALMVEADILIGVCVCASELGKK